MFYYHRATRQSSWTRPTTDGPAAVEEARAQPLVRRHQARRGNDASSVGSSSDGDALASGSGAVEGGTGGPGVVPGAAGEWVEMKDRKGRPYFYNRASKETRWTLPENATLKQQCRVQQHKRGGRVAALVADGDATTTRGRSSSVGTRTASATRRPQQRRRRLSSGSVAGWYEVWDASAKRAYYFHKATKRSTWTKPPEFLAAHAANGAHGAHGAGGGSPSGRGGLETGGGGEATATAAAPGSSVSDGRASREAVATPAAAGAGAGGDRISADGGAVQEHHRLRLTRAGSDPGARRVRRTLPSPWCRPTDPRTKRRYFYNKDTKQSYWRMPPELAALLETRTSVFAGVGSPNHNSDDASPVAARSKRSMSAPQSREADTQQSAANAANAGEQHLPAGWKAMKDKKGRTFFYDRNTKRVSWTPPRARLGASAAEPALPAGWSAVKDPSSRRTYYYHKTTGRSSWTRPTRSIEELRGGPAMAASRRVNGALSEQLGALKLAPGPAFEADSGAAGASAGADADADADANAAADANNDGVVTQHAASQSATESAATVDSRDGAQQSDVGSGAGSDAGGDADADADRGSDDSGATSKQPDVVAPEVLQGFRFANPSTCPWPRLNTYVGGAVSLSAARVPVSGVCVSKPDDKLVSSFGAVWCVHACNQRGKFWPSGISVGSPWATHAHAPMHHIPHSLTLFFL
mgnify:CR=1 FL=1